jgi:hypothetical protein
MEGQCWERGWVLCWHVWMTWQLAVGRHLVVIACLFGMMRDRTFRRVSVLVLGDRFKGVTVCSMHAGTPPMAGFNGTAHAQVVVGTLHLHSADEHR